MPKKSKDQRFMRISRHKRVRARVSGNAERPRLCVFRSLKHIYAQLIDDTSGVTLLASSTLNADVREKVKDDMGRIAQSKVVGQVLAEKALQQGIQSVTFDRAGYRYHGRVRALAEGAREAGLQF